VGGGSYTNDWAYDSSGNQITKATDTFVYGDENRLSRHPKSGANTDYAYNGLGQRVKKTGPGGTYRYVYDLDGKLLAEYAGASLVKEYLWMGGQLVGLTYNGTMYYVHTDHLGRPAIVADSAKAVVWKADNRAFDRDVLSNSIGGLNLGFPGQYYDSEKDSWYNYFRDYDANTGRYIQSDPIGLNGGMNTYAYVGGNPIARTDSLGLLCGTGACVVGATVTVGTVVGLVQGFTTAYNGGSFINGFAGGFAYGAGATLIGIVSGGTYVGTLAGSVVGFGLDSLVSGPPKLELDANSGDACEK